MAVIVLAAGLGKRFKSQTPKVLHEAAGLPLIAYVIKAISAAAFDKTIVVLGTNADKVTEEVKHHARGVEFVDQPEPLGTGDAVRRCRAILVGFAGNVVIVPGDTPMVKPETLQSIAAHHEKTNADATLLTARMDDPTGYGRIVRTQDGAFAKIVEESDANPADQAINEVSTGLWCFKAEQLFPALERVTTDNAQSEYYLPDASFVIASNGGMIETVMAEDPEEMAGVNDRMQLAEVSRRIRLRRLEEIARSGVTIEDPYTTYIDDGVEIGPDTIIRPSTYIEGKSQVGSGCEIGPNTRIVDSIVEDRAVITFAVVRGAHIGPEATVGPYASIRPGTRLGPRAKVGTFVEVKASIIGEGSKVPHQSYVGDAEIGRDVNLGAGTITGNYDNESKTKSNTRIEDGAFTGSNTTLVAPVTVGKDGGTGAGSVVTKDVPEGEIVAGVPAKSMRKRRPKSKN